MDEPATITRIVRRVSRVPKFQVLDDRGADMPNGRPGDHPLTDIIDHMIRTYSRRADALVRKLHKTVHPGLLWKFLYLMQRDGDEIRVEGSNARIPIEEFEDILAGLLESAERLAAEFETAEDEIKKRLRD